MAQQKTELQSAQSMSAVFAQLYPSIPTGHLDIERLSAYIIENSEEGVILADENSNIVFANPKIARMLGYEPDDLVGKHALELHDKDNQRVVLEKARIRRTGLREQYDIRFKHRDGHQVWAIVSASPLILDDDHYLGSLAMITDIDERKRSEKSRAELAAIVASSQDAIIGKTLDGVVTSWNRAAEDLYGYKEKEMKGQSVASLYHPDRQTEHQMILGQIRQGKAVDRYETVHLTKGGRSVDVSLSVSPVWNEAGDLIGAATISRDISDLKVAEETIRHQAEHDALTGLPNRRRLTLTLTEAIESSRKAGSQVAILFLDLDRFKEVNDTLGHELGDRLLKVVAERLCSCVKDRDVVARFGGDEFVVVLRDLQTVEDVQAIARRVLLEFRPPVQLDDWEIHARTSIGVAVYPQDGRSAEVLLRHADAALYKAKEHGRNTIRFYHAAMHQAANKRLQMEGDLRRAVEREEFHMMLQPVVDTACGALTGAEALVRWQHPVRGNIKPDEFIPLADECGMVTAIDEWMLMRVCQEQRLWREMGFQPVPIWLNLSLRQFIRPDLLEVIDRALEADHVPFELIGFELAERTVVAPPTSVRRQLLHLKQHGFGLAIDDFGIGHSALAQLKHLPIDTLKIDRSFVEHCVEDLKDAAILKAIINIAHSLGQKTVAEGVETEAQLLLLGSLGCNSAQGYYMSPPLAPLEFRAFAEKNRQVARPVVSKAGGLSAKPPLL